MTCVLTLALDDASQAHFESLRQRWFPPERNLIPAHVTLFHTLPEEPWVEDVLDAVAAAQAPLPLGTPAARSIGRGVAFFFERGSPAALHVRLSAVFAEVLTQQDRQGFRPHIVVQNKASAEAAAACLAGVRDVLPPKDITAAGLDLWRYLGGPWQHVRRFPFKGR